VVDFRILNPDDCWTIIGPWGLTWNTPKTIMEEVSSLYFSTLLPFWNSYFFFVVFTKNQVKSKQHVAHQLSIDRSKHGASKSNKVGQKLQQHCEDQGFDRDSMWFTILENHQILLVFGIPICTSWHVSLSLSESHPIWTWQNFWHYNTSRKKQSKSNPPFLMRALLTICPKKNITHQHRKSRNSLTWSSITYALVWLT